MQMADIGGDEGVSQLTSVAAASRSRPSDQRGHFAIYWDESRVHSKRFMGFGALWMVWERRGDLQHHWRDLHAKAPSAERVKCTKVAKQRCRSTSTRRRVLRAQLAIFHCLVLGRTEST